MPSRKDDLAERRLAKLVDRLHTMMSAALQPEYRGFYGQLVLHREAVAELGEPAQVRKAARAAGRQLGWQVRTYAAEDGTIVVIDDRDPPDEVRELAARRAADAVAAVITRARNDARLTRISQPNTFPRQPQQPDEHP